GSNTRLGPVESPRVIRAGGLAISATDAPRVVDDDDPVALFPRRLDGADLDARCVVALLALHRQVVFAGRGHRMLVRRRAALHVEAALLHLEDADVRIVRGAIVVVLAVASLCALSTPNANAQVQRVREFDPLD